MRRIQAQTQLRFRPNGPSVLIAWPGGPGPRSEKKYFQAQRADSSIFDRTTHGKLLARWADGLGWCWFPGPLAQAMGTAGPLGRNHNPPAHRAMFNAFRPKGPFVQIAWPNGPGTLVRKRCGRSQYPERGFWTADFRGRFQGCAPPATDCHRCGVKP